MSAVHGIGETCPVMEKAVARFGPCIAPIVLYEMTCFPADDETAMGQLTAIIRRVDAGETLDSLRVENEQAMERAAAAWRGK